MKRETYLDYNATAPIRPEVIDLIAAVMNEPGNASSIHSFGRRARAHIEAAREQVATLAGCHPNQVTFTSGATEANNAVLHSFRGRNIWRSAIEHPSVNEAAPDATVIPVTKDGVLDLDAFARMLESEAAPTLISVMLVNNETGAIQPVEQMARMARDKHPHVFIHCDAVQAAGRIKLDMPALRVDYMSLSAHKMGGPQGVGALICAPGARPARLFYGGGQEKRQRAGTENVAGIAGFGLAAQIAHDEIGNFQKLAALRDHMEAALKRIAPELVILAATAPRAANTSMISLPDVPAQTQIMALDLDGFAVSSGAACSSGKVKPSAVAKAMSLPEGIQTGATRISIGWATQEEEIRSFIAAWAKMYARLDKENRTKSA